MEVSFSLCASGSKVSADLIVVQRVQRTELLSRARNGQVQGSPYLGDR